MTPKVYVCFGTGGVGKTTVSAALGSALAASGLRTLVVTCDPARRLAEAFGVHPHHAPVHVGTHGPLWCFMPEAAESARQSVQLLFGHDLGRLESLRKNPVFNTLVDGLAGVHELGALAQLVEVSASFDALVIDTAPTRHALELLRLPERVGSLVDSRALVWLGEVSRRRLAEPRTAEQPRLLRWLNWGESRIVGALEASLGGAPVAACMELVSAGFDARPALSRIAASARTLLTGKATTYVLVASPREDAVADVAFFHQGLKDVAHPPSWLILNRTLEALPAWPGRVSRHALASANLRQTAQAAEQELTVYARQSRETHVALAARFPTMSMTCVPRMDAVIPEAVVRAAAGVMSGLVAQTRPAA